MNPPDLINDERLTMNHLAAEFILGTWERGQNQHPLDRALTMLQMLSGNRDGPGMTREQLAALPIIQRNERLLQLREQLFGSIFNGCVNCPQCSEKLEFTLSSTDIRALDKNKNENDAGEGEKKKPLEVTAGGVTVRFRLPDSRDLAAAVGYEDVQAACCLIVQRCVQEAAADGKPLDANQLPPAAAAALTSQIEKFQQEAEALLDLQCPACAHGWQIGFDIASFLWTEISTKARRLLGDVHVLASAYGWSENAILSLSPIRRQFYLEAVS